MTPSDKVEVEAAHAGNIGPIVGRDPGQAPLWLFAGAVVLGAVSLFLVLDGNRRASTAPTTRLTSIETIPARSTLPPLYVIPEPVSPPPPEMINTPLPEQPMAQSAQLAPRPPAPAPFAPQPPPPGYAPAPMFLPPQAQPQQQATASSSAVLVIDTTAGRPVESNAAVGADVAAAGQDGPARAARLNRHTNTVTQGTLIPAVLETALDSTRPGFVRAIVSRDVTGFDGSRVLIPRGSRLFGEYQADVTIGQNRAFVLWTRLVRPDGVTLALSSPAADLQGRAGVRGQVDTHFFERFGSALVQTTLDIGASLANRSLGGDGGVVVALPGAMQTATGSQSRTQIPPTLRVPAGSRVAVLVARDLDLPSSEARR